MRIILTSHGSTGDIYPVIAAGRALRDRGHEVIFATIPHWEPEIARAGLEFFPICPNWVQADLSYWMGRLQRLRNPVHQLREIYIGARQYIPEMIERMDTIVGTADLLVSSYLFPMNGAIAARHGVPFATLCFAHHTVPSDDYPPDQIPRLTWLPVSVQRRWNRQMWKLANAVVDRVINQAIGRELDTARLPKVREFFSAPAGKVLVTVSEKWMRPSAAMDPRFVFTGYCRWQSSELPALEEEIQRFTGGQPVPVITFGSMVYDNPGATMQRFIRHWPRDQKVILQRGWAQFPDVGDHPNVKIIGKVSHDQLFKHASVVIHHGGAGTTASALHSGKPQIVVPHIGDQPFFGREVVRIGCGISLGRKRWPENLAAAVREVQSRADYRSRASEVATSLAQEDGPGRVAQELEDYVTGLKNNEARHEAGRH